MKKFLAFLSITLVLMLSFQTIYAKILRVGYFGTPLSGVDYNNLQGAHDAAIAGDTIQLYPGSWNGTISKRLILLSKGYFLEGDGSNPNLQVLTGDVSVQLNLSNGSDSSIIEGINLDRGIYVSLNNTVNSIKIRRCRLSDLRFDSQTYDNWQITQCFIDNIYFRADFFGRPIGGRVTNLNINNNYIGNFNLYNGISFGMTGQLTNNIFGVNSTHYFKNGTFLLLSNIFIGASTNFSETLNCIFQNNLAENPSLLPVNNGNINGVDMSGTFVGYPIQGSFSNDGKFQLQNPGPAIGAGYSGDDAGMFGGANPYRLSGIPTISSFYKLTAPGVIASQNPYTITFSVKSNN